jgi:hypothetical protein
MSVTTLTALLCLIIAASAVKYSLATFTLSPSVTPGEQDAQILALEIHPHRTIDEWWSVQSEENKEVWALMHQHHLSFEDTKPLIEPDDTLGLAVMDLLDRRHRAISQADQPGPSTDYSSEAPAWAMA